EGHVVVALPGTSPRLFLPRFFLVKGELVLQRFEAWLTETLKDAMKSLAKRRGTLRSERASEVLDTAVRKAIQTLTISDPQEDLIRQFEFKVEIEVTRNVRRDWASREAILDKLNEAGFDICTTSKNKPGTIVTRAGKL